MPTNTEIGTQTSIKGGPCFLKLHGAVRKACMKYIIMQYKCYKNVNQA